MFSFDVLFTLFLSAEGSAACGVAAQDSCLFMSFSCPLKAFVCLLSWHGFIISMFCSSGLLFFIIVCLLNHNVLPPKCFIFLLICVLDIQASVWSWLYMGLNAVRAVIVLSPVLQYSMALYQPWWIFLEPPVKNINKWVPCPRRENLLVLAFIRYMGNCTDYLCLSHFLDLDLSIGLTLSLQ